MKRAIYQLLLSLLSFVLLLLLQVVDFWAMNKDTASNGYLKEIMSMHHSHDYIGKLIPQACPAECQVRHKRHAQRQGQGFEAGGRMPSIIGAQLSHRQPLDMENAAHSASALLSLHSASLPLQLLVLPPGSPLLPWQGG